MFTNPQPPNNHSKIALRTQQGVKFLDYREITYFEGCGRYTKIYLKNGKNLMVTRLLKSFESSLPNDAFFRIHRSYLVNINCIVELKTNHQSSLVLESGTRLEIAKRRKAALVQKLSGWWV